MKSFMLFLMLVFSIWAYSCSDQADTRVRNGASPVNAEVVAMMNHVAEGITAKGPIAWLDYLEYSPGFYMASEGKLQFPNIDSAENFIKNRLSKQIKKSSLNWNEIRVNPLNDSQADVSAQWYEVYTDTSGVETTHHGYFTAIAEKEKKQWLLRSMHWSLVN